MLLTVIAVGLTQIIGWGATFNLPGIIGPAIAESLDSSLDVVLLGPTVMLTILSIASWWAAPFFERFRARRMMIAGALTMAVGLVIVTLAESVSVFLLAWVLFGVGGAGCLSTAAQIALADIFGSRARQAIGSMSLVSGLANTILWPIIARIDSSVGWRPATGGFAAAMVLIFIPLVLMFVGGKPAPFPDAPQEEYLSQQLDPLLFALVAGSTALNGFITWGFSLTLIPLLMDKGVSNNQAVALASSLGVIQIAARLFDVLGNWSGLRSAIISTITMLFSFVVMWLGGSVASAVAFTVLYGLSAGLLSVVRATLPLAIFPPHSYAHAATKLALPLNMSFALAPPAFARILDSNGAGFTLGITITLSGVSFICLLVLAKVVNDRSRTSPSPFN